MTRASTSDDFPQPMRILRAKVIEELMSTERDYVDLLKNLVKVLHKWNFFLEICFFFRKKIVYSSSYTYITYIFRMEFILERLMKEYKSVMFRRVFEVFLRVLFKQQFK